ncbi:MAG: cysteine desulfurase [Flammeovirgaceae bacterium]
MLDIQRIRQDFPILHQEVNGHPLIYFDNAATSQKPKTVIQTLVSYYEGINSNVHRGAHYLADKATIAFEETRETIQKFINAKHLEEVILTKGTTESINIVASCFGRTFLNVGDEVLISTMEHHANIVPWQMICEQKGATLKVIPINDEGELDYEAFSRLLTQKTKIVAIVHVSNALGTINDVERIIGLAHQAGAKVLIDGAQSSPHLEIDVQKMDCDFYVFSSHKVYSPTGVGVLYGKKEVLNEMPPFLGGGEMIKEVTFEKTTYNQLPFKYEAGTPNIADTIAFKTGLEYVQKLGKPNIARHEEDLLLYATEKIQSLKKVRIIGTARDKIGVISFLVNGMHPYDTGMMLDAQGIAVRTGHHCAQPLMRRFGIEGTVRASFAVYNTKAEVDKFILALEKIVNKFSK